MRIDLEKLDLQKLASPMNPSAGVTASDEAIKREVVREIIWKRADFISTGVSLVGLRSFDNLDVRYTFASDAAVEYPVAEGSGADLTKVVWADFGLTLERAEGRFFITDEAKIRGVGDLQWQTGVRRVGEALALEKDTNILSTLWGGTAQTQAMTATWATATAAQITQDISTLITTLLGAHGATDADINNIELVVPIDAWSGLLRIFNVGGANVQLLNWIKGSYGINIRPTKYAVFTGNNRGVALIKGADTAIHGVLRPGVANIPMVETKRQEGVGMEYIIRQWFASTTIPEENGSMNTNRIVQMTGV